MMTYNNVGKTTFLFYNLHYRTFLKFTMKRDEQKNKQ